MVCSNSMSNVEVYQSELPQPQKKIVKRLRAFIARRYPELTESLKWHVPIYSLTEKNLLGLQDFTAHVNLNFFSGALLRDARGILIGTGKLVRHITFRSVADIDYGVLKGFIDQAIRLHLDTHSSRDSWRLPATRKPTRCPLPLPCPRRVAGWKLWPVLDETQGRARKGKSGTCRLSPKTLGWLVSD